MRSPRSGIADKLLGQVELVRQGARHVADDGCFTLITGVLVRRPLRTGTVTSLVNGALESFVKATAIEPPARQRINAVSPTVFVESLDVYGSLFPVSFSRTLNVVDAHAEGEPGKVVTGGLGPVPGETMFEALVHEDRPEGDEMIRSRNSQFDARVEATTTVGPFDAVVPSIAGRAWITSFNPLVLDPTDPLQEGFVVGRPWEPEH